MKEKVTGAASRENEDAIDDPPPGRFPHAVWHERPDMTEFILTFSYGAEVRHAFRSLGLKLALDWDGLSELTPFERRWLGYALIAISHGEDPEDCLRLRKPQRAPAVRNFYSLLCLVEQVGSYRRLHNCSKSAAIRSIAEHEIRERYQRHRARTFGRPLGISPADVEIMRGFYEAPETEIWGGKTLQAHIHDFALKLKGDLATFKRAVAALQRSKVRSPGEKIADEIEEIRERVAAAMERSREAKRAEGVGKKKG